MPQLDKFSFINQLFWFFLFYFVFYFVAIKTFIPTIGRTLKVRNKLLERLQNANTANAVKESNIVKYSQQILNIISINVNTILRKPQAVSGLQLINDNNFSALRKLFVEEMVKLQKIKKLLK